MAEELEMEYELIPIGPRREKLKRKNLQINPNKNTCFGG